MFFLGLAVGDVAHDADDPHRRARAVGHNHARALHPAQPAVVGSDHAIFALVAALGAQAVIHFLPQPLDIVGVDEAKGHVAALAPGRVRGDAGQDSHPFADENPVLDDVPLELAKARGVEGKLDPALVEADWRSASIVSASCASISLASAARSSSARRSASVCGAWASASPTDRTPMTSPPGAVIGAPAKNRTSTWCKLLPQGREPGIGVDVVAEDRARFADHQVRQGAGARILSGRNAYARLVPETVLIDEHDGVRGARNTSAAVRAIRSNRRVGSAVEGMQRP